MTKRPEVLKGYTRKRKCKCGSLYVTMNKSDGGKLVEVLTHLGKAGTCGRAVNEGYARLISQNLELGGTVESIIRTLKGISCSGTTDEIPSCMTSIALTLEQDINSPKGEIK